MRQLQVTTIPETLEAFLLPFADHFRNKGWIVDAAANGVTENTASSEHFDEVHDIPWSRNPLHSHNIRALGEIRSLLQRGRYDLVHVHTPVAAFTTRLAARRIRPRPALVYTAHGFHFHSDGGQLANAMFASLERIGGRWTDELVVINSDDYSAASRLRLVPPQKLSLIPGIGLDLDAFVARAEVGNPDPSSTKAELGIPAEAAVILMVAEFTTNKRQADAIDAFSMLPRDDTRLVFVGVGPTMVETKERAAAAGIGGRTLFLGYRRDVPRLLGIADALLLISEREGLPRSVIEAMAMSVPVIGTDIRGVRDLLGEGAGFLVPVGDIRAIANRLQELIAGGEEVQAMIRAAQVRAKRYSLRDVLEAYEAVYERALSPRRDIRPSSRL